MGNVIAALRNPNKSFIPYRASKLTRILQNSLNGDAKIALIATVSKCISNVNETISTLQFASRCRDVQLKPQINQLQDFDTTEEEEEEETEKTGSVHQMESVLDMENSVREFNYESESMLERQNSGKEGINQNKTRIEHQEVLEYLLKLLPSLKRVIFKENLYLILNKFLADKLPEIFVIRENFMTEILEELRKKLETVGSNMSKTEAQTYLKRHELLEGIVFTFTCCV